MPRLKRMRRSKVQAEALQEQLRSSGHTDVTIAKVTPTDWAVTWTIRQRITTREG